MPLSSSQQRSIYIGIRNGMLPGRAMELYVKKPDWEAGKKFIYKLKQRYPDLAGFDAVPKGRNLIEFYFIQLGARLTNREREKLEVKSPHVEALIAKVETPRKCLSCDNVFSHIEEPKNKRICDYCLPHVNRARAGIGW